ncbi:hypothetical protein PMAYCL1PPCAC_28620, partial [Pristionchus mayeri]
TCANGYCIDGEKCICDWGWTGKGCDEDIDECALSPCSEGATCLNTKGSFECICPEGRRGTLCEAGTCYRKEECLNGGICLDGECICTSSFTGPNCERTFTDPCVVTLDESPRCREYEVCVRNRSEILGFSCVCRPNFEGRFCDMPIDNFHRDTNRRPDVDEITTHNMVRADVNITVSVKPEFFVRKVDDFLISLSQRMKTSVKIRSSYGELDVFEWISVNGETRIGSRVDFGSRNDARAEYSPIRAKRSIEETTTGVLVTIQVT